MRPRQRAALTAPLRVLFTTLTSAVLLGTTVAGCSDSAPEPATGSPGSTGTSGAAPAPAPRYHFTRSADLEAAVKAQMRRDKTAATATSATVTAPGAEPTSLPEVAGAVRFGSDGTATHAARVVTVDGKPPALLEAKVLTNDSAYVKPTAAMGLGLPDDKAWVGPIQIQETMKGSRSQQLAIAATRTANEADPARSFSTALYGDAIKMVSATDEDLDGVPAVKYKIRVDVGQASVRQADPRSKRTLQTYVREGVTVVDVTLWTDAANRPLRLTTRGGPSQRVTTDIRYRDWGLPVSIDPPDAAQTTPPAQT